jgi:hypothetical protein
MACKRSGVRIPIAPPQFKGIIRNPKPQSSGVWYSSKVPQRQWREPPVPQSGYGPAGDEDCRHGLRRPDAGTASGFVTRQDASFAACDTCLATVCEPLLAPRRRGFAGDSCRLCRRSAGAGRAVSLVISPGYVGSVAGGPEVPEIMLPVVAPRMVAALRTKRLGRWRRRGAALGVRRGSAPVLRRGARRCGASARPQSEARAGRGVAPVHRYYLE